MTHVLTRPALISVAILTGVVACDPEPPLPEGFGRIQIAASTDDPHDVAQFELTVHQPFTELCGSAAATIVASSTVPLNVQQVLADDMFVIPEGDYRVCAAPQQADGSPSAECADASDIATVTNGQTTAVGMVSACTGGGNGALDVTVTLEDFPLIADIDIAPSKYFQLCDSITLTATLDDPGADGFNSVTWSVVNAPPLAAPVFGDATSATTSFATDVAGAYTVRLAVDDQLGGVQSLDFDLAASECTTTTNVLWAAGATVGAGDDSVTDVAHVGDDVVIAGRYTGPMDFGVGPLNSGSAYVARFDSDGNVLWSVHGDTAVHVGMDASSNGIFVWADKVTQGTAAFGCPATLNTWDFAKLNASTGACEWVVGIGEFPRAIAATGAGDVIVSVTTSSAVSLSNGTTVPAGNGGRGVLIKLAGADGSTEWATTIDGSGAETIDRVAVHPLDGSVVVAGKTTSTTVSFGGADIGGFTPAPIASFVAEFGGANGTFGWAQDAPADAQVRIDGLTVTGAGTTMAAYFAYGNIDFGGGSVDPNGTVIVHYDDDGNYALAIQLEDGDELLVTELSSAADHVRVAGRITAPTTIRGVALTPSGTSTGVVFALDGPTVRWALATQASSALAMGVSVAPDGTTAIAGEFSGGGPLTLGTTTVPELGGSDIFLAKLAP